MRHADDVLLTSDVASRPVLLGRQASDGLLLSDAASRPALLGLVAASASSSATCVVTAPTVRQPMLPSIADVRRVAHRFGGLVAEFSGDVIWIMDGLLGGAGTAIIVFGHGAEHAGAVAGAILATISRWQVRHARRRSPARG